MKIGKTGKPRSQEIDSLWTKATPPLNPPFDPIKPTFGQSSLETHPRSKGKEPLRASRGSCAGKRLRSAFASAAVGPCSPKGSTTTSARARGSHGWGQKSQYPTAPNRISYRISGTKPLEFPGADSPPKPIWAETPKLSATPRRNPRAEWKG